MRTAAAFAVAAAALVLGLAPTSAAPRRPYDGVALNVLPPGEDGGFTIGTHSLDQLRLYDRLTPLGGAVTARDLTRFFKPAHLGMAGERTLRTERPAGRPGLRILRDRWDVPHVFGRTRADVEFGAGWATAEDRGFLMELLRGPGRISALDVPGLDAFSLGVAAWRLGAGRARKEHPVSAAAGVVWTAGVGERVVEGQPLLELHTDDPARIPRALEALEGAIGVDGDDQPLPLILDRITA